jgi:hypothetical protein
MKLATNLAGLAGSVAVALYSTGCATWPTPVKVAATPFAVVRDAVDIPLASSATFCNYVSKSRRKTAGNIRSSGGYGWTHSRGRWSSGPSLGASIDVTAPVFAGLSYIFAAPDYLLGRSLCGSAEGKSPFKKGKSETWGEFLFPNMDELWSDEKEKTPVRYHRRRR